MKWTNRGGGASIFLLFLVEIEEIPGIYFESAGELENIVYADILLSALHRAHKVAIDLDHLAKLFLGKAALRAQGAETFAER